MTESKPRPPAFITAPPKRVLFLCTHNSARSQIAEAYARALAPAGAEVFSAGTEPTSPHALVAEVMAEVGIKVDGQHSKAIAEVPLQDMDTIVTLCAEAESACAGVQATVRR